MRGTYFSDTKSIEDKIRQAQTPAALVPATEDTTPAATEEVKTPEEVKSPDTVQDFATVKSIVAFIAHKMLSEHYNSTPNYWTSRYPALRGLTTEQVNAALGEALA